MPAIDSSASSFALHYSQQQTSQLKLEQTVRPVTHSYTGGKDLSNGVDLSDDPLIVTVGNQKLVLTGNFSSGQQLVDAINDADLDGLTASLNFRGQLKLKALTPVGISGSGTRPEHVNIGSTTAQPPQAPLYQIDTSVDIQHQQTLALALTTGDKTHQLLHSFSEAQQLTSQVTNYITASNGNFSRITPQQVQQLLSE